jgi:hypothetical protein
MRSAMLLAVLILAPLTDALTQGLPLRPGQRVRVTAPACGNRASSDRGLDRYEAEFSTLRQDGRLVLTRRNGVVSCPLSEVSQLDVLSPGRPVPGTAIGLGTAGMLLGGLAGALIGSAGAPDCAYCGLGEGIVGGAVGALLGAGVGVAIGLSIRVDREWVPVPLSELRIGLAPPQSGGLGLGASIAF